MRPWPPEWLEYLPLHPGQVPHEELRRAVREGHCLRSRRLVWLPGRPGRVRVEIERMRWDQSAPLLREPRPAPDVVVGVMRG